MTTLSGNGIHSAVPCAFINTENKPIKVSEWLAFNVTKQEDKLILFGTRRYEYPHPQAPEDANITVLVSEEITSARETDPKYSVLYTLMQAQKAALHLLKL